MKPLSKLHVEAVAKAKTEQDKIKAAANAMIETPMELIKAVLLKHEQAVIEVMRELSQEIDRLKSRTWVNLTDKEILQDGDSVVHNHSGLIDFARAIEAKLKEKNT
jgi:Na+/phosphate symporter